MTESPASQPTTPAPAPKRRFRYFLHIRRSFYVSLVLAVLNVSTVDRDLKVWQTLLLIAASVAVFTLTWTGYRFLMFHMPDGGFYTSVGLLLGLLAYLEWWEAPWAKWLIIPVVPVVLVGVALDYREAKKRLTVLYPKPASTEPAATGAELAVPDDPPPSSGTTSPYSPREG